VLLAIESVFPKGALVVIFHVFTFVVDAFVGMRAWFALSGF